jgi:hypothetical protein
MTKALAVALCLLARPAWAQVEVQVRTEKPQFLLGEPIFVLVEVKNVGTEEVAYSGVSFKPPLGLSVRNGERKVMKGLTGCGEEARFVGGAGVIDHPPMLQPGKSTTFRHLLRGYRLKPGTYDLRVTGAVDVQPVEGATIDRFLPLTVVTATEEALRSAYAPYVDAAAQSSTQAGHDAVHGILEMAPAFLEPEISKLVEQHGHERDIARLAAEALAEIDTASSRAALIDWFDRSDDVQVRSSIVGAVARARHPDNLPFLASLLPGRSTEGDNRIRRDAALGIGMIGGEAAVEALRNAPRSPAPLVAGAVLLALGNTRSKSAIPILIERAGENGHVSNVVCTALLTLTHLRWCGGVGLAETQQKWRTWWPANARNVIVHSPDDCPDRSALPHIW